MDKQSPLSIIILAAGKGKRMKSSLPKVLQTVGGKPMILHVVETARSLNPEKIAIIVGQDKEQVKEALTEKNITFVFQEEQLGTGHAVLQAKELFSGQKGNILVLSGDVPLLSQMTLDKLLNKHYVSNACATIVTTIFDDPAGYGRIIRNEKDNLDRIVEEKDSSESEKAIHEINAGIYLFDVQLLFHYLPQVGNDNAQREYYLPDVLPLMKSSGRPVAIDLLLNHQEVAGVNSQEQLTGVRRIYRELYEKN